MPQGYRLLPYRGEFGLATVLMWRRSFQGAMGLALGDDWLAVEHQLEFLSSIEPSNIRIVLDESSSEVAAFFAADAAEVDHLYVAEAHQGRGVGAYLLSQAKAESDGVLELFVFADNTNARQFYRHHGFEEIASGQARKEDNPWATSADQLRDVRCRWQRDGATLTT